MKQLRANVEQRLSLTDFEKYKQQTEETGKVNMREAESKLEKIVKFIEEKMLYKVEEVNYELKGFQATCKDRFRDID
jgi:hypothetical protein